MDGKEREVAAAFHEGHKPCRLTVRLFIVPVNQFM
jgi:hypothetical protein